MAAPAALHDMAARTRTGTNDWTMAIQYVILPREPSYTVRLAWPILPAAPARRSGSDYPTLEELREMPASCNHAASSSALGSVGMVSESKIVMGMAQGSLRRGRSDQARGPCLRSRARTFSCQIGEQYPSWTRMAENGSRSAAKNRVASAARPSCLLVACHGKRQLRPLQCRESGPSRSSVRTAL